MHIAVCKKSAQREARSARAKYAAAGAGAPELPADGALSCELPLRDALNSSFVLVPRGDMPFAYRLLEALAFGAVPVVVADEYILPFSEVVPWEDFSLHWPYARLSSLVPYLRTIPPEHVCEMRRRARRAWLDHFQTAAAQVDTLVRVLAAQAGLPSISPLDAEAR